VEQVEVAIGQRRLGGGAALREGRHDGRRSAGLREAAS
jgi:hypothetical protein